MKKNKNMKMFDLHFDDDINLIFNSRATEYINKLKIGNIINFTFKEDGRISKNKKLKNLKYYTGMVKKIYPNKFCINVGLENRRETMLVTANDICDGRYQEIIEERIIG